MTQQRLAQAIHQLVQDIPAEYIGRIAEVLRQAEAADWRQRRWQLTNAIAQPQLGQRLSRFVDEWQTQAAEVEPGSVAMGLLAAAQAENHHRQQQKLELVWTGPESEAIPLRRSDQALLQLINEAQQELHIVSFAVYKIEPITQALLAAARRQVRVSIYLETAAASEGRIAFDTISALGQAIARHARLYIWPLAQRPRSADGRHGSLHAKMAVADGRVLLISSANLTEYALSLNMEMGLLVRGGPLPGQVQAHLRELVERQVFQAQTDTTQ